MGLDSIEIVMAFEEAFGITITDDEAGKMLTPRIAIDVICTKLKLTDEKTCQSQQAFYILRHALMTTFHKRRNEISLDTSLKDLFPEGDCTARWFELQKAVDARSWLKPVPPHLLSILTEPSRRSIPNRFKTIRDLIPFVVTSNSVSWSCEMVAKVVKKIVIEQLGLKESKYSETASFINDLGVS